MAATNDGKKVAVIVVSGLENTTTPANQTFARNRLAEEELYRNAGYKVIRLGWDQDPKLSPTPENFKKQLSALRGVQDLQVSFIGHGDVHNVADNWAALDPKMFPAFRPQASDQFSVEDRIDSSKPVRFIMRDDISRPESFIGTGHIKTALDRVRDKNPKSAATLKVMNCYGANVSRDLADQTGTQVFSSTTRYRPAHVLRGDGAPFDFMTLLNQDLAKGKTYHEAFLNAQTEFIEASFFKNATDPIEPGFPRSQAMETMKYVCHRLDQKTEGSLECANCGTRNAYSDIVRAQALDRATAAPKAALAQLKAVRTSPACRASLREFDQALEEVRQRARGLSSKQDHVWQNALDQLTDADRAQLNQDFQTQMYIPDSAQLSPAEFKARLHTLGTNDPSALLLLLRLNTAETVGHLRTQRKRCGLEGEVRGMAYLMTPTDLRRVGEQALSCIESSEADPQAKLILARQIAFTLASARETPARCDVSRVIHDYEADLACATQFAADATDADWKRLIELNELGARRVVQK